MLELWLGDLMDISKAFNETTVNLWIDVVINNINLKKGLTSS